MKSQNIAWTLALFTACMTAHEASAEVYAEPTAVALFEQGVLTAQAEKWDEALELFRRSSAVYPRRITEFNVASALYHLGRFDEAEHAFRAYLQRADDSDDATTRIEAERYLTECERTSEAKTFVAPGPEPRREAPVAVLPALPGVERVVTQNEAPPSPLWPPAESPRTSSSIVKSPLFWVVTGAILVGTGVVLGFALRPGETVDSGSVASAQSSAPAI